MDKEAMLKEALQKLENERETVIRCHKNIETLTEELNTRDELIYSLKEHMGSDNFNEFLRLQGEAK